MNTFENNFAVNQGGGINCYQSSSPFISECTFSNNTANMGGGINLQLNSNARILDNQFVQNTSNTGGAAILCSDTDEIVIKRNLIDGNRSDKNGGGIYLHLASEALIDSNTIINNSAGDGAGIQGFGGGILCYDGPTPTITNNIIQNNTANTEGGGIHMNERCSGVIENNDIQYNSAGYQEKGDWATGGGVFLCQADPVVRNNIISNNISGQGAGGIFIQNFYPWNNPDNLYPLITNNIITNNIAYYDGGGIATSHCDSSVIVGNTIANNVAMHGGGAIHVRFHSKTYIDSNTIENNQSFNSGGGAIIVSHPGSYPTICNNTIVDNSTDNNGGGINCLKYTSAMINNNLFLRNHGKWGGAISTGDSTLVIIKRNTFVENTSEEIGATVCSDGNLGVLIISNNTFFKNDISSGSSIKTGNKTFALIQNNIIANESSEEPLLIGNYSRVQIQYNCFWSANGDSIGMGFNDSLQNIFADPKFSAGDSLVFDLLAGSPCIDVGNPESGLDLDGTRIDIGRFYFDQRGITIEPPDEFIGKQPFAHLVQNYPNPFNPTTTITLMIGENLSKTVDINVFNSRGHLVKHLFNGPLDEGVHRFVWDGKNNRKADVGSGIYFCRVKTQESESTIKMLLKK